MTFYFGAHFNLKQMDINECFTEVQKAGGNLIQVNTTNNLENKINKKYLKENNLGIVIHSHYFINIAKDTAVATKCLVKDINIANNIGAIGVVVHTGKSVSLSIKEAKENMYNTLMDVAKQTIKCKNVKIILETASGQGTETCVSIEEFAEFYNKLKKSKFGNRFTICIDTCHIFAAGYNIKNNNGMTEYLKCLEELVGENQIGLLHLNDSKKPLNSNVDRHDAVGEGFIGKVALKNIFRLFKNRNICIILETPTIHKSLKDQINLLLE